MVHLKDPEDPEPIETQMIFPKDKVDKNSVELVSINADALAKQDKLKKQKKAQEDLELKETIKREKKFV